METEEGKTTNADSDMAPLEFDFPETDVTLVVEVKKFYVNRAVLSQHSPVFDAMFNGHFKESTEKEIVLEDKKAEDFVEFLRSFYPNMKHPITEKNVLRVLPLAHEYHSSLVKDCEDVMVKKCQPETGITVSTLLDYILAAEKFDLTNFLDTAVKFCSHVDFELLSGKTFSRQSIASVFNIRFNYKESRDEVVHRKFLQLSSKMQYSIAKERLQNMELYKKRIYNGEKVESDDYKISLS